MQLIKVLNKFKTDVNLNSRIRSVIRDWQPDLYVEELDGKNTYKIVIDNGEIVNVLEIEYVDDEKNLLVSANRNILLSVFSGKLNPIRAYSNGEIEMYGSHKDQVKLDTVCLLLWGI